MPHLEQEIADVQGPAMGVAGLASPQSRVAQLLLTALSEKCAAYCMLTGYEQLPESFDSDIDFMVSSRDFKTMPALIDELSLASGCSLFQAIQHEVSARAFRLAADLGGAYSFIQPDSCADYRHYGRLWLRADEVLAARRRHPRGFWIPAAAHEFIYYLIKRINKRDLAAAHGERLSRLYAEDSQGCDRLLVRFWGPQAARHLGQCASLGDWHPVLADVAGYRRRLRRATMGSLFRAPLSLGEEGLHTLARILRPTGAWIAFIGPDGCGKSSVIEAVVAQLGPAFQKVVRFHLRPKSLPARPTSQAAVLDPHGQPLRGTLSSIAKMLYLAADYWIGYFKATRSATMRTRLVIFDRYFYDILIDPKRVCYGGPAWLPALLSTLLPRPEVVLLLNAAPEVLWSRKQEVAYDEVVRQQQAYLQLAANLPNVAILDASQPLAAVVHDACASIVRVLSARTRRRLGIAQSSYSHPTNGNQVRKEQPATDDLS